MKLERIKAKLAKLLIEMGAIKTNKAVINWDGGEDLVAGMNVYSTNENGEKVNIEDGEYITEDGKTIVVKDNKVDSIVDPIAEVDAESNVESATTESATTETELEETESATTESEQTEIEKLREEVNELYKLIDSILNKIGETRKEADERFSKLEQMSAAKSVVEDFENTKDESSTGNSKLDKQFNRLKEMNRNWRD